MALTDTQFEALKEQLRKKQQRMGTEEYNAFVSGAQTQAPSVVEAQQQITAQQASEPDFAKSVVAPAAGVISGFAQLGRPFQRLAGKAIEALTGIEMRGGSQEEAEQALAQMGVPVESAQFKAARFAGKAAPFVMTSSGAVAATKPVTALQGLLQGAKFGAGTGAVEGAIMGFGEAVEDERSAKEVLYGTATGSLLGGLAGGILGGAFGAWGGYKAGQQIKAENFADDLVSPKLSPKERARAIAEGRLQDPTAYQRATIKASEFDNKIANSVRDIVSPEKTVSENIDNILIKVDDTNQGVLEYVRQNKVPFNKAQAKTALMKGKEDLQLVFASDSAAEKTYDKVVDAFMDQVKSGDTEGFFRARQNFDNLPAVKKLLETDVLGENARKEIVLAVRGSGNDYVASLLPKGNTFKADLLNEHFMLEAVRNISEKAAVDPVGAFSNEFGRSKLQSMFARHPILYSLGSGLVGATGVSILTGANN